MKLNKQQIKITTLILAITATVLFLYPSFKPPTVQSYDSKDLLLPEWSVYENKQLGYKVVYPSDWKLITYKSNGYPAIGLYDVLAQNQNSNIPDLIQGAKIEIVASDYLPKKPLKDYIIERNQLFTVFEILTDIREIFIDNEKINAVRDEHNFKNSKGTRISFIGRDKKFYTLSLILPNYKSLNSKKVIEYPNVFDNLVASFEFLD